MVLNSIQGILYLLLNPKQIRHLLIRETKYKDRLKNKKKWIEFQKYNSARMTKALKNYEAESLMQPFNIARIRTISRMINQLKKNLFILDVGGANGAIGKHLWKLGNNVVTLDLPSVVSNNRNKEILAVGGDAEKLPYRDNFFDIILASEIVEHLWDPVAFFNQSYRVLKNGGYLIVSTPDGKGGLRFDSHKHFFTVDILQNMMNKTFKLIEVERLANVDTPTPTIIVKFNKILEDFSDSPD